MVYKYIDHASFSSITGRLANYFLLAFIFAMLCLSIAYSCLHHEITALTIYTYTQAKIIHHNGQTVTHGRNASENIYAIVV